MLAAVRVELALSKLDPSLGLRVVRAVKEKAKYFVALSFSRGICRLCGELGSSCCSSVRHTRLRVLRRRRAEVGRGVRLQQRAAHAATRAAAAPCRTACGTRGLRVLRRRRAEVGRGVRLQQRAAHAATRAAAAPCRSRGAACGSARQVDPALVRRASSVRHTRLRVLRPAPCRSRARRAAAAACGTRGYACCGGAVQNSVRHTRLRVLRRRRAEVGRGVRLQQRAAHAATRAAAAPCRSRARRAAAAACGTRGYACCGGAVQNSVRHTRLRVLRRRRAEVGRGVRLQQRAAHAATRAAAAPCRSRARRAAAAACGTRGYACCGGAVQK
ncbi:hypothetical protein ACJJTC_001665 [Scirpophaga incertulas]